MTIEDVVSINLGLKRVVLATGEIVPITDFLDEEGDETDDPELALIVIAGPFGPHQRWLAIDIVGFSPAMVLQ